MDTNRVRWLFGDQLGPHFLDSPDQAVLLIESRAVFGRRMFHRRKAHLILSAMRHRAAELGDQCRYLQADSYTEALARIDEPLEVVQPTSWGAVHFVDRLAREREVERLPARGYATSREQFATWAETRGRRRLLMEDYYRDARTRLDVLMDGAEPVTGRWNYDQDNRKPAPKGSAGVGVPEPPWPVEDEIDAEVREDLDRWQAEGLRMVGQDGPRRFAATRLEALSALEAFILERLPTFGPYEDAVLSTDRWMAHSMLSAPLNLGLLDPLEMVRAAEDAFREGHAPICLGGGLCPAGNRLAGVHVASLLVPRRGLPAPQRVGGDCGHTRLVLGARPGWNPGQLPEPHAAIPAGGRLGPPHSPVDDLRQLRLAAGLASGAADRVVPPVVRRRL